MIKVISYLGPSGSSFYRCEQVFKYLNKTGEFQCLISPTGIQDDQLLWADIVFVKELVDPVMISTLWAYKEERGKVLIVDRDDALIVKEDNPYSEKHKELNAAIWQRETIKMANKVICTGQEIAEECRQYNDKVDVIPNYLDIEMWDTPTTTNDTDILRIGWAGSVTHHNDLDIAMPAVVRILKEYPKTKFVYVGDPYPEKYLTEFNRDRYEFVQATASIYDWPNKAQTLALDMAIAPLEDNHFNRCKSYLKYMEYAMIKAPGVYSPTVFDQIVKDGKNGLIAKDTQGFYEGLKNLIQNPNLRRSIRKEAYHHVRYTCDIATHYGKYSWIFKQCLQDRGVKTRNAWSSRE